MGMETEIEMDMEILEFDFKIIGKYNLIEGMHISV